MSSAVITPSTTQLVYSASSERLDSIAPFGRDSVPLVYMIRMTASSSTAGAEQPAGGGSRQASQDAHSAEPSPRSTTWRAPDTPLEASAPAAVAARSLP